MNVKKKGWPNPIAYIFICAVAVFLSFFLHELAHWATGEILGYKMALTLNSSYALDAFYSKSWHQLAISAGGPVFSIIQAIVFFFIIKRSHNALLYPFLFFPLYMRLLAGIMNIFNLNDEGRIGHELGIGVYTLSALVCTFLFYLVFKTSKQELYTVKYNLQTMLWVLVFSSVLILSDQFFKARMI